METVSFILVFNTVTDIQRSLLICDFGVKAKSNFPFLPRYYKLRYCADVLHFKAIFIWTAEKAVGNWNFND